MTTLEMARNTQNNLSQELVQSNQTMTETNDTKQIINLNGSYMFQDKESMDSLLNKIGLAVQRKGGK